MNSQDLDMQKQGMEIPTEMTLEKLRESEDRLRLALDGANAERVEIDLIERTVTISNGWCRHLGYSPEEVPKDFDSLKSMLHPADLMTNERAILRHIREKTPFFEFESRLARKNGGYVYIMTRGKVTFNGDDQPEKIFGITFDVTERRQREAEYRHSFMMWDATLNSLEESLFVLDKEGAIVECNSAAAQMLKKTKNEVTGHLCCDAIHHRSRPLSNCPFNRVLKSRKPEYAEVSIGDRYYEVKVEPIVNVNNEMTGAVMMLKDMTERQRAIDALEINRYYLTKAQEIGVIGTWDLDIQENILKWTDENYHIFGVPVGTPLDYDVFLNCVHPDDRDYVNREWNAAIKGKPYDIEHRLIVNKKIKWVREKADIARDERGRGIQAIGVTQDITHRKVAEQERERLQDELLQAHKMESVGRLAGGVAHDFNNMLGVIMGHTEIALEASDIPTSLEHHLLEIQKAARRSAELTRQLLAFARKQTITPQIIDINEKVASTLNMLTRLLGEDVSLEWRPGPNVWPIKLDPVQLDQILANLCVNARDAISGVGRIVIQTQNTTMALDECAKHSVFVPGDYVLLTVKDNGCGMDKKVLNRLFEPFYTTKGLGEGTGLGLATVYGIVSQNNGFVTVDSQVNEGTVFQVYMPRSIEKQISSLPPQPIDVTGDVTETVLVVEDEAALLDLSAKMLESFGYHVLTAATPGEAIKIADEYDGKIHLLLSDVIMPEMSGRDLARRIVTCYPAIKRLYMSGYTANVIAERGILGPGVSFIQKPFRKSELLEKVQEVLAN